MQQAPAGTVGYNAAVGGVTVNQPVSGHNAVAPQPQGYVQGNSAPASFLNGEGMVPQGQALPIYGLDYLARLDQIIVKQLIEPLEFLGIEMNNRYRIFNTEGQQVFFAAEDTDACQRMMFGPNRGFLIKVTNNNNEELFRIIREFKLCPCPCACADAFAFEVFIQTPDGEPIGRVRQEAGCDPRFSLRDAVGQIIGEINFSGCDACTKACSDREFPITTQDGTTEIGRIQKKWAGMLREAFTDADGFTVSFPVNMDVKAKTIFIGALFLLDFMYFEKKK